MRSLSTLSILTPSNCDKNCYLIVQLRIWIYMFKLKKLMKFSFPDQSYWVTSFIYSKILFFSQLANIRYNIFMYFWRISWPTLWTPVNNDISGAIYGSEFRMPSYSLRGWSFPIGPAFDRNCLRSCLWTCRGK